jgi:hypothetical protein
MYSRLYYPQAADNQSLLKFARESLDRPNLTESEINEETAFHISKHTKVFQDVYLKLGGLIMDSKTDCKGLLAQLRN